MKTISFTLLLFFVFTGSMHAGKYRYIKKDDSTYKSLKMSVEIKESSKDKNIYAVKIEVGKDVSSLGSFYIHGKNKYQSFKPAIKDSKAYIEFEIEKKIILASQVNFSYPNGSRCPPSFSLELKNFLKETIAKKDSK